MALADLFRRKAPQPSRPSVVRTVREARGEPDVDEYAFRLLRGGTQRNDLPQPFVAQILRDSHWMYESHGLAERIIERACSLILEGGPTYAVEFVPSFEDRYPEYAKLIRTRLENWWYSKDADMPARIDDALRELLLSGEHGWRLKVSDNGWVRIGDLTRYDVRDLAADAFDKRRLAQITIEGGQTGEEIPLEILHECDDLERTEYKHLVGDCVYMRLKTRASKMRGRPLLQAVIDELRNEKRFRMLSADRSITRMGSFVDITVDGDAEDVEAIRAEYEDRPPENGRAFVHNKQVEAKYESASIESNELANMYRNNITIIAGFLGMPISWFGYGDGSTKATSETQQGPAEIDYKSMRERFLSAVKDLLYFVVDQAIISGAVASSSLDRTVEVTDEDGQTLRRRIRDCVTITVSTRPLAEEKPKTTPLAATTAVMDIISKDDLRAQATGVKLFPPEKEIELVNFALGSDGTGVEVVYEATSERPIPAEV